jgi:hypothetical protein
MLFEEFIREPAALFPAPEYALEIREPQALGNRETGIAITLQVIGDRYREILAIKPAQMIADFTLISPGLALELTPV